MSKPILCLDFDGVLHSYSSGWKGADVISDPPTDGAMRFLMDAADHFKISILSSRSHQPGGKSAMKVWLREHFLSHWAADRTRAEDVLAEIDWPSEKPGAFISIDDRALCFDGTWPEPKALLTFKPWNNRALSATPSPATGERDAVLDEIGAERKRHVEQEGWTPEHDDEHRNGEMARAATCYIMGRTRFGDAHGPEYLWPDEWDDKWWKPTTYRRNLIKAAALIVAEVERLDRLQSRPAERT